MCDLYSLNQKRDAVARFFCEGSPEWLRLRSAERKKELVPVETFDLAIAELAGATLVAMSESRAGCFPLMCQNAEAAKR